MKVFALIGKAVCVIVETPFSINSECSLQLSGLAIATVFSQCAYPKPLLAGLALQVLW